VDIVYIALSLFMISFSFVFFGLGMNRICDIVGSSYPIFMSFKVMEKPDDEKLKYWLVYWVVYGLFQTVESFSDSIFSWIPLYYPVKLLFLVWCFLPQYKGAATIYKSLVRPVLKGNEAHIDEGLKRTSRAVSRTVSEVSGQLERKVRATSVQLSKAIKSNAINWLLNSQLESENNTNSDGNDSDSESIEGLSKQQSPVIAPVPLVFDANGTAIINPVQNTTDDNLNQLINESVQANQ